MKFIKKNIVLIMVVILLLVLAIVGFIFAKNMFFSNDEKAIYGTRLDGIDKVKIIS